MTRTDLWRCAKKYGLSATAALTLIASMSIVGRPSQATTVKTGTRAHATSQAAPTKSYGSKSAPITMEVFTDYECPSCGMFFEQTLRPAINDYVSAGKVYLVHHDFPLQMHTYSGQAARWANAAARIGDFQIVESALYDNQAAWTADGNIQKYVAAAISTSDLKRVEALMKGCDGPAPQAKADKSSPLPPGDHACPIDLAIASDIEMGYQLPVVATPTYVISYKGRRMTPGNGYLSWPVLKQFFDSLLAQ